jgi:hypothetical protein
MDFTYAISIMKSMGYVPKPETIMRSSVGDVGHPERDFLLLLTGFVKWYRT